METHDSVAPCSVDARQRKMSPKSQSPLMFIPCFNSVDGYVPDYIHAVLLEVVKQMSRLWFDSVIPQILGIWAV